MNVGATERCAVAAAALLIGGALQCSALGTAFTYQGQLQQSGAPSNDTCDFQFSLFGAALGGAQIGSMQTASPIAVANGLFTVQLDFGDRAFDGNDRWLQIAVRCPTGNGNYTTLAPRQPLTAAPYALYAPTAGIANDVSCAGCLGTANLTNGAVTTTKLSASGSTSGQVLTSNGSEVAWQTPSAATGWELTGNGGTIPGTNYVGTSDNKALELRVNGARALRIEPTATTPNMVGGFGGNRVAAPMDTGATIGGGGGDTYENVASAFATVGGGLKNGATGPFTTIGGGLINSAGGPGATVAGGGNNAADGQACTVGGGNNNTADGGSYITVAGGQDNHGSASAATIGGGEDNQATGNDSTVGGGDENIASGTLATVPGGYQNEAKGYASFAAGYNAHATHDRSFVWSDGTRAGLSAHPYDFNVTSVGGVEFWHGGDAHCDLHSDAVGWNCTSDRNVKENFVPVDAHDTLHRLSALPVTWWNLKGADPSHKHIGPVAQDFHAAFGLGEDTMINTSDAQGVAFAAIKGLYELMREKDAAITALQQHNAALEARLAVLERAVGERVAHLDNASQPSGP